jgi:hypothetical protein
MNKVSIIFLLIVLLLTGCDQSNGQVKLTPTSIAVDLTATPVSVPTPTLITLPLPTPSPTISSPFEQDCPNFMGEVSMETIARGTIFPYNSETEITSLLDLQSGQEYPLPLERKTQTFSGSISPDRKYYAYTEPNQALSRTIIWVINAKAQVLVKQAVDNYLFNLRWLDDTHLLFDTKDTEEQAKVVVFNLKTSEFNVVAHELPGLFTQRDVGLYWRVSYSPDLQKALYIGKPQADAAMRPIYRDLVYQKTLWEAPPLESIGEPLWSSDGQQVALMVNWDLYIIRMDGQVVDILEKSQFGYFNEWSYSWSPNGQYIGFRSSKEMGQDSAATLMIYNMKSKRAVNYCLEGYSYDAPGWSPDSTQIVVDTVDIGGILLDLPTNRSFRLVFY